MADTRDHPRRCRAQRAIVDDRGGHGISLFAEEAVATNTANVVFLPITDEPEAISFSAVWSPNNSSPMLHNLLNLAARMVGASSARSAPILSALLLSRPTMPHDPATRRAQPTW